MDMSTGLCVKVSRSSAICSTVGRCPPHDGFRAKRRKAEQAEQAAGEQIRYGVAITVACLFNLSQSCSNGTTIQPQRFVIVTNRSGLPHDVRVFVTNGTTTPAQETVFVSNIDDLRTLGIRS